MAGKILKGAWCIFLTLPMVAGFWNEKQMRENWEVFSNISTFIVLQNLLVICVEAGMGLASVRLRGRLNPQNRSVASPASGSAGVAAFDPGSYASVSGLHHLPGL